MNPFLKEYPNDHTDHELIKGALSGNEKSLEGLLKKHQPYIYNIAWKMVQRPDDAADLTQEVLIKITTHLSKFNFESTFRTWAYRIVVNHFLNGKKRGNESFISDFGDMAAALDGIEDQPMTEMEQQESKDLIREMNLSCMSGMLLCLNREQRLVYIIGEMLGGDHTIGSEIMGMSKDNFRAKLKKARKDLYSFMNDRCGLVNKSNPCRCHKKVHVAVDSGQINAKELLFNRKEYGTFRQNIAEDADYLFDEIDKQYTEMYRDMKFKEGFDRKIFIENILSDTDWKKRFNLT